MQMVAGVIASAELTGMTWIAHRSVKIENAVKCAAGANPLIHALTCSLPVLAVVISAFIRRQRGAEHTDSMLMSTRNDLLQAHDQLLRRHQFTGKRSLFHGGAIGQ